MARKIRCNDEVIVLTGKDKGKRGKVRCIVSSEKVIVSGVNIIKKHQKLSPSTQGGGGIIQKEAAISVSNVAIFNADLCKADRIGFKIINNKKVRVLKSTGKILE